ncbi:DUF6233 domain-containing protein [Streptomyces sp. NPDC059176]|uniref:DUF6233 domain-containing protein n=1 Tax=Streptomyces sp. NPDC059176 TaxID=3346758 RepID=UPI0036A7D764
MSEPSRLDKLRALRDWLAYQLRQTDAKISELEQQQAQAASYKVEAEIRTGHPLGATVHRGDCTMAQRPTRPIAADEARLALAKDPAFTGCEFCRPGDGIGMPEASA